MLIFCLRFASAGSEREKRLSAHGGSVCGHDRLWGRYSCPAIKSSVEAVSAVVRRNKWGQLGEILGGVQTREQRQLPFSSCLGSGKKRRTGASIKISKAGAALRFAEPPRG